MQEPTANKPAPAKSKNPLGLLWDLFNSVKLTVFLLLILAVVSIIGTVIDQTNPEKNMQMLIGMFGPDSAPRVLKLLVDTGMTNMYHTWWFVGLLSMLVGNISVCTLDKLPRAIKVVRTPIAPLSDEALKNSSLKREVRIKGDVASVRASVEATVRSAGFSPNVSEDGGAVQFYAEKGKISRLGAYITHISLIIIFIGALIGSFWGYKAYAQIMENQSVDKAELLNKPLFSKFGDSVPLGFQVRCDKFTLKMYESGMPSDYLSDLTIIDGGKEVLKKRIRVNDPLDYNSIRFFQSSYGVSSGMAKMLLRVTPKDGSGRIHDYPVMKGEQFQVEGTPYAIQVGEMSPDVVIGPNNQLIAQSDQFKGRGAAVIKVVSNGEIVDQAVILNEAPESQPQKSPFTIQIMDYRGPFYTGLQVTYDPGVWIVWLGCTFMVVGTLVAFMTYHKKLWVSVKPADKGQVSVTLAGSANKNRQAFEGEFLRLVEKLGSK